MHLNQTLPAESCTPTVLVHQPLSHTAIPHQTQSQTYTAPYEPTFKEPSHHSRESTFCCYQPRHASLNTSTPTAPPIILLTAFDTYLKYISIPFIMSTPWIIIALCLSCRKIAPAPSKPYTALLSKSISWKQSHHHPRQAQFTHKST